MQDDNSTKDKKNNVPAVRDAKGRWLVSGNTEGRITPGIRSRQLINQRREAFRKALRQFLPELPDIVDALTKQAKRGDVVSAKILFDQFLGRIVVPETTLSEMTTPELIQEARDLIHDEEIDAREDKDEPSDKN